MSLHLHQVFYNIYRLLNSSRIHDGENVSWHTQDRLVTHKCAATQWLRNTDLEINLPYRN